MSEIPVASDGPTTSAMPGQRAEKQISPDASSDQSRGGEAAEKELGAVPGL